MNDGIIHFVLISHSVCMKDMLIFYTRCCKLRKQIVK